MQLADVKHRLALQKRFWARVEAQPSGCWLWVGTRHRDGRGVLKVNGKTRFASRISYVLRHGAVSDDLLVCHSCDNPLCVNPDHLFLGTVADNNRDATIKGRRPCKVPREQHAAIREARAKGLSLRALGRQFGVSNVAIFKILSQRVAA